MPKANSDQREEFYDHEQEDTENTKNKKLEDIISKVNNYFKEKNNNNTLLILKYKTPEYIHHKVFMNTSKNNLISFINNNIQYHNTIKNMDLFHNYNRNPVKSLEKFIH